VLALCPGGEVGSDTQVYPEDPSKRQAGTPRQRNLPVLVSGIPGAGNLTNQVLLGPGRPDPDTVVNEFAVGHSGDPFDRHSVATISREKLIVE
jgi:hypothetical protein